MVTDSMCVELGTALGLNNYDIKASLHDYRHEIFSAAHDILHKWAVTKESRVDAWQELAVALRECDMNEFVREILMQ